MASLNCVHLIGNLTRDPETRYTPKGIAVSDITLAVNRKFKADGGEQKEEVTFIGVVLWGKQAELAKEHLRKGSSVFIEGRITVESWQDKENPGKKNSKTKVVCENMQFLGGKLQGERRQSPEFDLED